MSGAEMFAIDRAAADARAPIRVAFEAGRFVVRGLGALCVLAGADAARAAYVALRAEWRSR